MGRRSAEDLDAPAGSFELITIGEAFHRLDQALVARQAFAWLRPGCCLATLGCENVRSGREEWQAVLVAALVRRLGREVGSRSSASADVRERVLRASGFEIESHELAVPYVWTVESIVGNLYSTSMASKEVLGDGAEAFEADVTRELFSYDSSGRYPVTLRFGFTLARPTDLVEQF